MLFDDVVAASTAVAATRSRAAKASSIAALLGRAGTGEIEPVSAWLSGEVRQGRLGIGRQSLSRSAGEPADTASLTVTAVDVALGELATAAGPGSTARRGAVLRRLLCAMTPDEQRFLVRLLAGELRQGASRESCWTPSPRRPPCPPRSSDGPSCSPAGCRRPPPPH